MTTEALTFVGMLLTVTGGLAYMVWSALRSAVRVVRDARLSDEERARVLLASVQHVGRG